MIKKFINIFICILFIAAVCIVNASCRPTDNTYKYRIGVTLASYKFPFFIRMKESIEKTADLYQFRVDIVDADLNPSKQANQIETFITQKKDLIIVVATHQNAIVPAVIKCNDAGIPVITIDRQLGEGASVLAHVGQDDIVGGWEQGELVNELLEGKGNIILCQGNLGASSQTLRQMGLEKYLNEKAPNIKLIAMLSCDWDKNKTITAVQNALLKYPEGKVDAIVTQDNNMAIGALRAIEASRRTDLYGKIVAFTFPEEIKEAISNGDIYGSVIQDPGLEGELSIKMAHYYFAGELENIKPVTYIDLPMVTKKNVLNYEALW